MKKIILLIAILLGSITANAQVNQGNVMIGGTLANFSADFDHSTSLSLTPKAAWFIRDGLALGGYVNFGFTHINGGATTYNYGFGPIARYYLNTDKEVKVKNVKFFLEANAGFDGASTTKGGGSTNGLGFGVGPGVAYFLSPNIGLEALVKYDAIAGFGSNTFTDKLNLGIGFQIYFSGSKIENTIKKVR